MNPLTISSVLLLAVLLPWRCTAQDSLESTVKRLLGEPTYTSGFDVHELQRSGDRATVTALRLLDPETIRTEKVVSRMIFLIGTAFEDVDMIQLPDDRNPGVSMFFLRVAQLQGYSPEINHAITRLIDHLIQIRRQVAARRRP
jgi:hypothetical protein